MERIRHWERVYSDTPATGVSWHQTHAELSLLLIRQTGLDQDAALIDVGGGASTLVDDLVEAGYRDLTVLDLATTALDIARKRLGARGNAVHWRQGDILDTRFEEGRFALWHDRAVFHFLTSAEDRARYVEQARRALRPGGHLIVAAFAEDGPERCSGLPVVRYRPEALAAQFGNAFRPVESRREIHRTPLGKTQPFVYCCCIKE